MQDCKYGCGLQFVKFDFVTGSQEIKIAILVEFDFFRHHVGSLLDIHHFWS